ncbi:ubiquitin-like modifier hub1, variant 2 [Bonamia ostreae]|uniref:Ubiquitin-like modifier hub1, variant 2 n=1 Tax=Bonamia ostreae TaxID=126728 RepID=A0ABV2AI83_9EUKA
MIMCKTFMSSRPFGGDLSLKGCKKGKLCERAHGNEDLRPGRNDHQKFNSVEKSFFKQAKEEIGEGDNRSGKKLNLDSIDFLNVDFDLSNIPEEGEGESVEIAKMRKELESVTSKCKELTESYKKNYYDIVDAVTKRIEKETKEMRLSCKEEVRYLEKLAKKRLEEMDDLRFRLKCPLCHNRNRNAVLVPLLQYSQ